jgi:hypothetical protein
VILVDYTCRACGRIQETWAASPPTPVVACGRCGADAQRQWAPVGLTRGGHGEPLSASARAAASPPLCSRYPQVPGVCHMSESAGRMWVARYLRDNRTVDAELARQERQAGQKPPTMADAITHHHFATSDG